MRLEYRSIAWNTVISAWNTEIVAWNAVNIAWNKRDRLE